MNEGASTIGEGSGPNKGLESGLDIGLDIEKRVAEAFKLEHLEVVNESHQHSVPANSQTHFKLVLVSDEFDGVSRINRHRSINALVDDLLAGPVHAMALHPYTIAEWRKRFGEAPLSPPCHGGEQNSPLDASSP